VRFYPRLRVGLPWGAGVYTRALMVQLARLTPSLWAGSASKRRGGWLAWLVIIVGNFEVQRALCGVSPVAGITLKRPKLLSRMIGHSEVS
jgi:hypothetical protein